MLFAIIIVGKCIACVVWRIDTNTFNTAGIILFERFQRKQIVPVNQHIAIPRSAIGKHTRFNLAVGVFGILNQNPWFQCRLFIIFPNPSKFQFLQFFILRHNICFRTKTKIQKYSEMKWISEIFDRRDYQPAVAPPPPESPPPKLPPLMPPPNPPPLPLPPTIMGATTTRGMM